MAQQATLNRTAPTAANTPRMGRPPGSRNKTSEEKRLSGKEKVFDYARYKQTFQKPADFYLYLAGYPDKTGLLGYVYRLRPRIDLSLIGIEETYIHTTTVETEMTEEFIAEQFGRGFYMLVLNDANRPKGQTEVCKTWFDCGTAQKAPQYDPRTLCLGEPKNLDEINRLLNAGILVRDSSTSPPRVRTNSDGAPPAAAVAPAHNGAGDPFARVDMGAVLLSLINRGSANPHDTVKDTIEIARMLQPVTPPLDVETIVERVVARLGGKAKGEGREFDAFATYERMEGFLSKFRGPAAAASAAAVDSGDSWAPHLKGIFAEARGLLAEGFAAFRELKENGDGAINVTPQQNGGHPQPMMKMEQRIEQVFRLGYQKMQEGVTGFDYAAWVCSFHPGGLEVYKTLEPTGAVGLIALAAMNPQARVVVNDPQIRPQLEVFLTDFFSFDADGDSGAVEESAAGASGS
jgi:hypothetical protein